MYFFSQINDKICIHVNYLPTVNDYNIRFYKWSCSVLSDSLWPYRVYSPWNSLGQNIGVAAFPFSGGSSQPRDWTGVSCIAGRFFSTWATREAHDFTRFYILGELFENSQSSDLFLQISSVLELQASFTKVKFIF